MRPLPATVYREDLRNHLIRLAGTGDIHRTTTAIDEAGRRLSRLFATQMMINAATGAFIGLALFVIGVPGAALWGTLTLILRFVPYVGTLLAAVFPIIIAAAVGEGWTLALLTLGVTVVSAYSELLEELWPEPDDAADGTSTVVVIAAHGALNFAAALSVSAFLRVKNVPHRLLPPDAINPGKFPDTLAKGAGIACLCYLTAPSEARFAYVERRIAARLPGARILGIAWRDVEGARAMLAPEHALALLPSDRPESATKAAQPRPEPSLSNP